jgi:ketosteroid isomerase-like protein
MSRWVTLGFGIGIGAVLTMTVAMQQPRGATAETVIAITKAEWAAAMQKNTAAALENVADDCTIWVPEFPNRINGKEQLYATNEAQSSGSGALILAQMSNEHVQVYGDVAVLSYNFFGAAKSDDGKVENITAKSSRVYVKKNNEWWLVHANFAPVVTD